MSEQTNESQLSQESMSGDEIIKLTRERLPDRPIEEEGFKEGGVVPLEERGGFAFDGFKESMKPRVPPTMAMDIDGIRVTYRWIFGRWEIESFIRK